MPCKHVKKEKIMKKFFLRIINKIRTLFAKLRGRGVYYVGGPEVLPAPLSKEEENRALENIESDPACRALLIEHNLRLVVYIAKKFENTGVGVEDLVSIGTIGLIKAINTFKSDKNIKLATYASRCIENEILMYIRKNGNVRQEISIDEPLSCDWDGNELLLSDILANDDDQVYRTIEEEEDRKIIRDSLSKLDERERLIIELRYGLSGRPEKTQKEVADMLGISQSYISRLEKKIISRMKYEIENKV